MRLPSMHLLMLEIAGVVIIAYRQVVLLLASTVTRLKLSKFSSIYHPRPFLSQILEYQQQQQPKIPLEPKVSKAYCPLWAYCQ